APRRVFGGLRIRPQRPMHRLAFMLVGCPAPGRPHEFHAHILLREIVDWKTFRFAEQHRALAVGERLAGEDDAHAPRAYLGMDPVAGGILGFRPLGDERIHGHGIEDFRALRHKILHYRSAGEKSSGPAFRTITRRGAPSISSPP